MKKSILSTILAVLAATLVVVPLSAHAASHTIVQAMDAVKAAGANCPKAERGKVSKIEVISADEVKKRTSGGMKAGPGNYLVVHAAKGGQKDFTISATPLAAGASANDFKPLIGQPACLPPAD